MPQFDAGRGFQPRLNVRDFDYLLHLLEEKDSYPNGVLWPLVAARRAGKTWRSRRSGTTLARHGHCTSTSAARMSHPWQS